MKNKGFTLIELMIIICIIGILAAVAIPNFIAFRDKASDAMSVIVDDSSNTYQTNNPEVITKCINGSLYTIKNNKKSKMVKKDSSVIGGLSDVYCYD